MRRRQPANPTIPPEARPAGYDWTRFGRHRLRTASAILLDHPLTAGWVATTWSDPTQPDGWNRLGWQPNPAGGWTLPARLALGDIVELGACGTGWFGIVDSYEPGGWLTLQGPYPNAAAAADHAEQLLATERYQPAIEPPRPRSTRRPCTRRRQRPGRHP